MKNILFIKITFSAIFLCIYTNLDAQNSGYLGQRNIVEVNTTITTPVIANLFSLTSSDNFLTEKNVRPLNDQKDRFDFGYGVSYMRILSRKFSAGIYIGADQFSVGSKYIDRYENSEIYYNNFYEYYGELELFDFKTFTIMPKIEYARNSTILPIGFSHQIGFGIKTISLIEKEYKSDLKEYVTDFNGYNEYLQFISPAAKTEFNTNMFDYSDNKFKAKMIMYALNMRTPISDRLLINYGFQYTFNFIKKVETYSSNNVLAEKYWFTKEEMSNLIRSDKQLSFILFNFGLSFSF